jgi:hypothetical protein
MTASIDLADARTALGQKPLFGFADVVTAEGISSNAAARGPPLQRSAR